MNSADLVHFGLGVFLVCWGLAVWTAWDIFKSSPSPEVPALYTGAVPARWVVEEYWRERPTGRIRYCFNYSDGDHEFVSVKVPEGRRLMLACDGNVVGWRDV